MSLSFQTLLTDPKGTAEVDLGNLSSAINHLNDLRIALDGKLWNVKVGTPNNHSQPFSLSSWHIVVFCRLTDVDTVEVKDVIFKFRFEKEYKKDLSQKIFVRCMTDDERRDTSEKYRRLRRHLEDLNYLAPGKFSNIFVNRNYESKINGVNMWVEDYIHDFARFTPKKNNMNHDVWLVSSSVGQLRELQKHIYFMSDKSYTVCDLQGGTITVGDNETYIILADIEFTDTLCNDGRLLLAYKSLKSKSLQNDPQPRIRRPVEPNTNHIVLVGFAATFALLGFLIFRP